MPVNARLKGFSATWLKPIMFTGLGIIFVIVGMVLLRAGMKAKKTVGD